MVALLWALWSAGILMGAKIAAKRATIESPWSAELAAQAPPLARWDAGWYYEIASEGYRYERDTAANNIHFYPLYPVLAGILSRLTRIPLFDLGIALSLASLLGALLLLADLSTGTYGTRAMLPPLIAMLVFPTSFYFASFYTESLFLLTTVTAFRAAEKGRWGLAGVAGAAASLTRLNGFVIALPIAWFAWEAVGRKTSRLRPAHFFGLGAPLAAAALFPLFLWVRFGSPLLFFRSENSGWSHHPTPVWQLLWSILREAKWRILDPGTGGKLQFLLQVGSLVLFVALTILLFRQRRIPGGLYAAGTLLILLNSGSVDAMHRYVLILFPCFLVLAEVLSRHRAAAFAYFVGSSALLVTLLKRFVQWVWVA